MNSSVFQTGWNTIIFCFLSIAWGVYQIADFVRSFNYQHQRLRFIDNCQRKKNPFLLLYFLDGASYRVWTINTDHSTIENMFCLLTLFFFLQTDSEEHTFKWKHIDCISETQYELGLGHVCTLYWPHYKNTSCKPSVLKLRGVQGVKNHCWGSMSNRGNIWSETKMI